MVKMFVVGCELYMFVTVVYMYIYWIYCTKNILCRIFILFLFFNCFVIYYIMLFFTFLQETSLYENFVSESKNEYQTEQLYVWRSKTTSVP
jgi:hypothetical protein